MTPFAQLGCLQKAAYSSPYQAAPPVAAPQKVNWGREGLELAADVGLGWNAATGVPWFLGKALWSGVQGKWGDALANAGLAGVSFIPGAGSAAAAAKTGLKLGGMGLRTLKVGAPVGVGLAQGLAGPPNPQQGQEAGLTPYGAAGQSMAMQNPYGAFPSPYGNFYGNFRNQVGNLAGSIA